MTIRIRAFFGVRDFNPTLNTNTLVVSGRTEALRVESPCALKAPARGFSINTVFKFHLTQML